MHTSDDVTSATATMFTELDRLGIENMRCGIAHYLEDYKTVERAFEGHYVHSGVKVRKEAVELNFYKGDIVVFPDQTSNRYIVEMLEPQGVDSYFAWNFFDPVLMEKEYFSDYVFEDLAAELLGNDAELKSATENKKKNDPAFAKDQRAQLYFVYTHSRYYEPTHKRYPVARIEKATGLPLEK